MLRENFDESFFEKSLDHGLSGLEITVARVIKLQVQDLGPPGFYSPENFSKKSF